ncbi:hypothetical protein GCM10009839_61930 [Catenulispora yoronensis]|uniref:Uncharacterized protein n=1 Tax=Catenulispora yoronensis TaxID=450799 RepID=A0ABN2V0W4_9ACTN
MAGAAAAAEREAVDDAAAVTADTLSAPPTARAVSAAANVRARMCMLGLLSGTVARRTLLPGNPIGKRGGAIDWDC